jgi:hypothetical protein
MTKQELEELLEWSGPQADDVEMEDYFDGDTDNEGREAAFMCGFETSVDEGE